MTATIHYLDWDDPDNQDAREKFADLHFDDTVSEEEFGEMYEEIATDVAADTETVFMKWNRGSGEESDEFIEKEVRSFSVGDIIEVNGSKFLCRTVGWQELDF